MIKNKPELTIIMVTSSRRNNRLFPEYFGVENGKIIRWENLRYINKELLSELFSLH